MIRGFGTGLHGNKRENETTTRIYEHFNFIFNRLPFYMWGRGQKIQTIEGIQIEIGCEKCLFESHFAILDSVVEANPSDSIFECCMQSIYFMVKQTKIEVSTDGSLLGRTSFAKRDWIRWHAWYDKKYAPPHPNRPIH